ncbi:MAG: ATP synthase subunit alpha [Microgenomates group bacterium GW2011_GWA1_48_10]|nr:MAG: ATP synthase subunit alpha [Microgenomates group bacterium GW2011_GWA1_48_10]
MAGSKKKVSGESGEIGFVRAAKGFLIRLDGLPSVKINDVIVAESGALAYVSSILPSFVEAFVLGGQTVSVGEAFRPTGRSLGLAVGDFLLGRVVGPMGEVLDGLGKMDAAGAKEFPLEKLAVGVAYREFITRPLLTGITVVDTLFPLGMGQRELVIGDPRSGKSSFLMEVILNQAKSGVICVYGAIGRPVTFVRGFMDLILGSGETAKNTVMVARFSTDSAPLVSLTPKAAMAVGEYFSGMGKDVLVVLDDMGTHAKAYREMALLSERFPGREAYPGDIFHEQAAILERAGNFNDQGGGGSITALPVIELPTDDFVNYIPTNLMGMTDGHLLFNTSLRAQGRRPAIDVSLSVSRVGAQTQNQTQNRLGIKVKETLARADELSTLVGFGGELPPSTQLVINQGSLLREFFSQPGGVSLSVAEQIILLSLPFIRYLGDKDRTFVGRNKAILLQAFREDPELVKFSQEVTKLAFGDVQAGLEKISGRIKEWVEKRSGVDREKVEVVDRETWLPDI